MAESIKAEVLVSDIVNQAVSQPSDEERTRMERLTLLQGFRITTQTEVKPEAYALSVDGTGIFALGDVHLVKGKPKSGKSALLKVCAAALMAGQQFRVKSELKEPKVLIADTEQQLADVKLISDEVKWMTGIEDGYIDSHLFLYSLRRRSYDTLLEDTRLLIGEFSPQVVFIDGLADYVQSFNDEQLSRQLVGELMKLCDEYGCAIVCCMHENKALDDRNPKGHTGSIMNQKSGTVLECVRLSSGILSISCAEARHGAMPTWNICFDGKGHIADASDMVRQEQEQKARNRWERDQAKREKVEQERVEAIRHILREAGGYATRKELKLRLMDKLQLKDSTVQKFITDFLGKYINETNGTIRLIDEPDLFT